VNICGKIPGGQTGKQCYNNKCCYSFGAKDNKKLPAVFFEDVSPQLASYHETNYAQGEHIEGRKKFDGISADDVQSGLAYDEAYDDVADHLWDPELLEYACTYRSEEYGQPHQQNDVEMLNTLG